MEENKTMEMEVMDNNEVVDTYESEETSGKGISVVAVGAIAAGIGLGIVAAKKCKGKLEDWKVKSLEKKGYVVTKPETDVVDAEAEVVDSDEDEEK